MWGTEGFEESIQTGGIRKWPPIVVVGAEPDTGCTRVAGAAEHRKPVEPVEHPATQSERLKEEYAVVGCGGQFGASLGERVLLHKRQRNRIVVIP
ncbi:Uncharacterised protein [Mycobacteroides abscessus subsp. massiliense]|nr:Uncharacterised protein [Mycobacteroides abscessus subsp. massiliense]